MQVFNDHQMAKLKESEAFTVEREREIQQASKIFLICCYLITCRDLMLIAMMLMN